MLLSINQYQATQLLTTEINLDYDKIKHHKASTFDFFFHLPRQIFLAGLLPTHTPARSTALIRQAQLILFLSFFFAHFFMCVYVTELEVSNDILKSQRGKQKPQKNKKAEKQLG